MPHIAETDFHHRRFHLLGQFHLAVQLAQIGAVRHDDWQLQSRLQRKIMQIEAQGLRDGADDIEEIESGHDGRFYGAKIANLEKQNKNARQHIKAENFHLKQQFLFVKLKTLLFLSLNHDMKTVKP